MQKYVPTFNDIFVYAQILYNAHMYKPAAPMFELALEKLKEGLGKQQQNNDGPRGDRSSGDGIRHVGVTSARQRAIFETAITEDPDYPMYYYNLACADAEEKNLVGAQKHLREAFARKANVIPGERLPDPTKDDSFLPYRDNKEFWSFVNSLQGKE